MICLTWLKQSVERQLELNFVTHSIFLIQMPLTRCHCIRCVTVFLNKSFTLLTCAFFTTYLSSQQNIHTEQLLLFRYKKFFYIYWCCHSIPVYTAENAVTPLFYNGKSDFECSCVVAIKQWTCENKSKLRKNYFRLYVKNLHVWQKFDCSN